MKFIIDIFRVLLNVVYSFHKLAKTKDKVTIISRQSNVPSSDILLIVDLMNDLPNKAEIQVLTQKIEGGLLGKLKYIFHIIGPQMRAIATSKIVIVDGYCIPISVLKHKKELVVIQMWHAMGALKKFGYSIIGEEEGSREVIAKGMNMHKGYDYIFASSQQCIDFLCEAYNAKRDKFVVMPLPRVDLIKDDKYINEFKSRIINKYGNNEGKKNILYSPTFRKGTKNFDYIKDLINSIDYDKYNLYIVPHPLMGNELTSDKAIIVYDFTSIEMLSICDCIVTDYSAFIFEAALAGKPIYIYVPDYEEYNNKRGFYIDLQQEDFAFISEDPKEIVGAILEDKYDLEKIKSFSKKYVDDKSNNTREIVDFINKKRG